MALSGLDGAVARAKSGIGQQRRQRQQPPPSALAKTTTSALRGQAALARKRPVRPSPVCTSSAISSAPCLTVRWHRVST